MKMAALLLIPMIVLISGCTQEVRPPVETEIQEVQKKVDAIVAQYQKFLENTRCHLMDNGTAIIFDCPKKGVTGTSSGSFLGFHNSSGTTRCKRISGSENYNCTRREWVEDIVDLSSGVARCYSIRGDNYNCTFTEHPVVEPIQKSSHITFYTNFEVYYAITCDLLGGRGPPSVVYIVTDVATKEKVLEPTEEKCRQQEDSKVRDFCYTCLTKITKDPRFCQNILSEQRPDCESYAS